MLKLALIILAAHALPLAASPAATKTATLAVETDCDIPGHDLTSLALADAERCRDACLERSDCQGLTFISGWNRCFLKAKAKRKVKLVMHAGVIETGAQSERRAGPATPRTDNTGKDLVRVSHLNSAAACGEACLANATCVAYVFLDGYGDCWLKKTKGRTVAKVFHCAVKEPPAKDR